MTDEEVPSAGVSIQKLSRAHSVEMFLIGSPFQFLPAHGDSISPEPLRFLSPPRLSSHFQCAHFISCQKSKTDISQNPPPIPQIKQLPRSIQ
jgi:hypothetical protein